MKMKKMLSILMAAAISAGALAGCTKSEDASSNGKVKLTVGNWVDEEANPEAYKTSMERKAEFEKKYPDIEVIPDNWAYDVQTFAAKAEGETLPIVYNTHFTEAKKIIELGYAADITDAMKQYGYFPTTQNAGGWNFTALAWNFGGTFMKQNGDKWESDFNQGTTDALQWLKDLMWEDGSMPSTTLISNDDSMKMIGTDQAAMAFAHSAQVDILVGSYGMKPEDIGYAAMPAGPARHVTLMGGGYNVIAPQATPEQIDAAFKWLEFSGSTSATTLSDDAKTSLKADYQTKYDEGKSVIGIKDLSIWTDKEATQHYKNELIEEFRNIDGITIRVFLWDSLDCANPYADPIEY